MKNNTKKTLLTILYAIISLYFVAMLLNTRQEVKLLEKVEAEQAMRGRIIFGVDSVIEALVYGDD